ncbi:MAG: D-alanyl-D-alanine carboxypeptidase [Aquisalinus sp.]|nr:D-alanyl-D-alanine carboxypeptidase [Aquisalinus sp.]
MRARFATFILFALLSVFAIQPASASERYFSTKATHAIIVDDASGVVLYDKNADVPIPPASMSKLMTVAVVFDALQDGQISLDTEFYVSEEAWRLGGSKMFVLVDTTIPVRDLLKGMIVASGNDACLVVAQNLTAPMVGRIDHESQLADPADFVALMNRKAAEWGLADSSFANPTGLPDPGQRMSLRDLARLARHIIHTYPEYFEFFRLPEFTWSDITQQNRNPLIAGFDGAEGMKTGHTEEAGFGVVGSATVNGQRRIMVLAGLGSMNERVSEANRVMGLAFSEFDTRKFFSAGDIVGEAEVFMGQIDTVPLKLRNDVSYTMHRRKLAGARAELVYTGPLKAPLDANQQVAVLRIELPGEEVQEYPLFTSEQVRGIGLFGKLAEGARALLTPPSAADIE